MHFPVSSVRRTGIVLLILASVNTALVWLFHDSISFSKLVSLAWDERVTIDSLWGYVGNDLLSSMQPTERAWEWANTQRSLSIPSAGALISTGPKAFLRTNIDPSKQYYMAFVVSGWNNMVIDIFNLLHVAIILKRIPILPAFKGHEPHLGGPIKRLAVGEVFDLARFSASYDGMPIVEAFELKSHVDLPDHLKSWEGAEPFETPEHEELGCWTMRTGEAMTHPQWDATGLIWTPLPEKVFAGGGWERPSFDVLTDILTNYKQGVLPDGSIERAGGLPPDLKPDEQIACLDYGYWLHTNPGRDLHSEFRAGEGAWKTVGQHLHFTSGVQKIADDYLRFLFGLNSRSPLPPYMVIHIRRGDFDSRFKAITHRQWANKAFYVLSCLKVEVRHVVIATDEQDPEWRAEFEPYGFYMIDHTASRTGERLGWWFPTVIDTVIMGSATGFLGVASSSMSILAARRVVDWNGGVAEYMWDAGHVVDPEWFDSLAKDTRV